MKLNLLLNNASWVRSGYLNLDPHAPENDPQRTRASVVQLDDHVDDGEVEELLAHDVLEYIPGREADQVLNHWVKKLAHGGILSIRTPDLRAIAHGLTYRLITIDDANLVLHGDQAQDWQTCKATYSLDHLVKVLEGKGLKIIRRLKDGYHCLVVAQRP